MTERMSQSNLAETSAEEIAKLRELILKRLISTTGKDQTSASQRDWFIATALVVRDRIIKAWITSENINYEQGRRRVYYLSLEFLIGRLLMDALNNLGLTGEIREALAGLDVDLDKLSEMEPDAALGNGGLGRLAACFMESMATLGIAAYGYGIRYDHGLFRQAIKDGWQHEYPEDWLASAIPGNFRGRRSTMPIGFGGPVRRSPTGSVAQIWRPAEVIEALPTTRPSRAGAATCEHASAVAAKAPIPCASMFQRGRLVARSDGTGPGRASPRCSIRATRPRPARSFGCARNISSRPPRCRTSFAAT